MLYWLDRRLDTSPTFYLLNNALAAKSTLRDIWYGSTRTFAEPTVGNNLTYHHRLERFRRQLEQLAGYCRDNGIASQWIVPASAESVYEPDRSVVAEGTSASEIERMHRRYDEARGLEQSKSWQQAIDIYREELAKQPGFAELHFRLAECLVELGQYDQARKEFILARDTDGCPTRANGDYRRQIAEVAEEFQIPHFDAADVLRPETPHGIIDRSMIHDNVHPTLLAFYLIAMHAADQIGHTTLAPRLGSPQNAAPVTLTDAVKSQDLVVNDLVHAYQYTAEDFRFFALLRFDDSRRKREADEYEQRSKQLKSGEIKPGQNGTESFD
nr:hypothetical protein [uncultured bacterium]